MNIYLIRHGETDWNLEERLQGHTDIPLNQNGRLQINHAAEVLANLCVGIDLIVSSPLLRAYESAEIFAERLSYEKDKIVKTYEDCNDILVVAHGAILYAILTAITDGEITYGGEMVKFEQASIHLMKYIDGTIQLAKYNEDSSKFTDICFCEMGKDMGSKG